jgi:hypothetical protein
VDVLGIVNYVHRDDNSQGIAWILLVQAQNYGVLLSKGTFGSAAEFGKEVAIDYNEVAGFRLASAVTVGVS